MAAEGQLSLLVQCVCVWGGFQEDSQVCGLGKAVSGRSPPGFERLADHLGMEM